MYRKFLISILITLITLVYSPPASAHVLQRNNDIGVVLHITPDDDPIAKQESSFFFSFKDRNNTFTLSHCDCEFSILQDKKLLYTQPLLPSDITIENDATAVFTFPEKNVYTIRISGKPLAGAAFKSFILSYPLRVEREVTELSNPPSHFEQFFLLIVSGVAMLVFFVIIVVRKQQKKSS